MSARKTAPSVSHPPAGAALSQPCASIHELGARGLDYLGPERGLRRDSGGKLRGRGAHRHHAELVEAFAHIAQRQDAHRLAVGAWQ
jgi:hypothetical protein